MVVVVVVFVGCSSNTQNGGLMQPFEGPPCAVFFGGDSSTTHYSINTDSKHARDQWYEYRQIGIKGKLKKKPNNCYINVMRSDEWDAFIASLARRGFMSGMIRKFPNPVTIGQLVLV